MITEFETQLGVIFQIDSDDLTYRRWFKNPQTDKKPGHGRLVKVPEEIVIGSGVTLLVREYDNTVQVFHTTPVVVVRYYNLESPEELPPDLTVN